VAVAVVPRLSQLLEPVVLATGHDLEALQVTPAGRRRVVRMVVDKDGGTTLDDVADVSRAVSEALDDIDAREPALLGGAYVLEVSSPGVDRPLTQPRHWRRNVGRLVTAHLADGGTAAGRLLEATDTEVVLGERRLLLAEVVRGQVQVEFDRPAGPAPDGAAGGALPEVEDDDVADEDEDEDGDGDT
jgi:ribosome maturation factor RimP